MNKYFSQQDARKKLEIAFFNRFFVSSIKEVDMFTKKSLFDSIFF